MVASSLLPATWNVPEEFRSRLGAKVGRQRAMFGDGHLLLILHRPPRVDEDERTGRFFWRSPDGSWASSDLGSGPQALNKHIEEYGDLIDKYDRQEEEADEAEDYFDVLRGISPLSRAARHLHQVLQEARKSCPEDRSIINYRDRAYETERAAELLYDGTRHSLDFAIAKRAEEQARSSNQMAVSAHRLNLLAAFFFPIATLAAVFGINLKTGLEDLTPPIPFVAVMLLGFALGFVFRASVTRFSQARTASKLTRRYGP